MDGSHLSTKFKYCYMIDYRFKECLFLCVFHFWQHMWSTNLRLKGFWQHCLLLANCHSSSFSHLWPETECSCPHLAVLLDSSFLLVRIQYLFIMYLEIVQFGRGVSGMGVISPVSLLLPATRSLWITPKALGFKNCGICLRTLPFNDKHDTVLYYVRETDITSKCSICHSFQ